MAGPATPLAIVAGSGALPRRLAEARAEAGLPYLVVCFAAAEPWMAVHPVEIHRFERPGVFFRALKRQGVTHVVMAGETLRPKLSLLRLDLYGLTRLPAALAQLRRGDDALLRWVEGLFRQQGFTVIAPEVVLGEALRLGAGPLGRRGPSGADLADAARAAAIVRALGPLDVGQGAVVARGLCLGIEAAEGTDLMLARIAALPAERRAAAPPPCGILFKAPKPAQDRRFDMPAIGPATVRGALAAGLAGIVVAADGALCPERDEMREAADRAGLFVYGATPDELAGGR